MLLPKWRPWRSPATRTFSLENDPNTQIADIICSGISFAAPCLGRDLVFFFIVLNSRHLHTLLAFDRGYSVGNLQSEPSHRNGSVIPRYLGRTAASSNRLGLILHWELKLKVKARIVETAAVKAIGEEGKFSPAYARETPVLLVNANDAENWHLEEGTSVSCTNPATNRNVVLTVRMSRFVKIGTVNLVKSPWVNEIVDTRANTVDLDIELVSGEPVPLEDLRRTP
jgi:formylmethanofuran dehydrogenase subunit D